jgi:hypothetical protein
MPSTIVKLLQLKRFVNTVWVLNKVCTKNGNIRCLTRTAIKASVALHNANSPAWVQQRVSLCEVPAFYCASPLTGAVSGAGMRFMEIKRTGSISPELN